MQEQPERNHYAALLTVQILFGLFPVVAKKVLAPAGPLEPFPLLALRVGGAAFCLLALHLVLVRNPIPIRQQFPKVTLLAFLGVVLNMGLFMVGLQKTDPTEAVLVITTIPVFTYAIAVLLRRETVGPKRILGIVLAVAGVIVLVGFHPKKEHAIGDLLIMGNALSYAAFLVLARPTLQKYDALSLTTWMFLIGALVFVPIGLASGLRTELAHLSTGGLGLVAFIIIGPSVLTYVLNAVALRHVASSTVAAFTYIQPVFTAVAQYVLLPGTVFNNNVWMAAPLVFAGVWLVTRKSPAVLQGQTVVE